MERQSDERAELDALRVKCRRQRHVIDALGEAIATFSTGASALKAENADLRALNEGRRGRRDRSGPTRLPRGPRGVTESSRRPASGSCAEAASEPVEPVELVEARFTPDLQAPAAARAVLAGRLGDQVPRAVLDSARLITSELVTNSVRHSGALPGESVVLRVSLSQTMVRLEVDDPGRGGAIAPRPPDADGRGGGYGLTLVQSLSERWGVERVAAGGTSVWAQIAL